MAEQNSEHVADEPPAAPAWLIRSGRQGRYADDFLTGGYVAIGGVEIGELPKDASDEEVDRLYDQKHPQESEGTRRSWASLTKRFLRDLVPGTVVATYDPSQRLYFIGTITSEPEWHPERELPRTRRVKWSHKTPRDRLSASARNSLGSTLTLFRISDEVGIEMQPSAVPLDQPTSDSSTQTSGKPAWADESPDTILRDEVIEKSEAFIEDRIARLAWDELQELVAGVLRAMGFQTRVSDAGPDRGVDVFASPDGLGLLEPRIFVEVKHRPTSAIGASDIRSFLGGRQQGDRCLYVSTGGFTREARYEAERASVPTTLVDLPLLRKLIHDHYETLDAPTRALIPLQRLYWPVR